MNGRFVLKKLKLFLSLIVALSSIQGLNADIITTAQAEFLKQVANKQGVYKVLSGSDPRCHEEARLTFVMKSRNKGFRLGQRIFFGPFNRLETAVNPLSCQYDSLFIFTLNSVTKTNKTHHCPKERKNEEAISTSTFSFEKNQIIFKIKESKYKCLYELDQLDRKK